MDSRDERARRDTTSDHLANERTLLAWTRAAIERGSFRPTSRAGALLTIIVVVFGVALIGYLLVTATSL